eukprot:347615-Rhodomonas_salina.1
MRTPPDTIDSAGCPALVSESLSLSARFAPPSILVTPSPKLCPSPFRSHVPNPPPVSRQNIVTSASIRSKDISGSSHLRTSSPPKGFLSDTGPLQTATQPQPCGHPPVSSCDTLPSVPARPSLSDCAFPTPLLCSSSTPKIARHGPQGPVGEH